MPAMLYRPPGLVDRVSAVIRAGATLACSVTTLVAGGRDVGIANVRVRAATAVASVPLVAERKLKVPAPLPVKATEPMTATLTVMVAVPVYATPAIGWNTTLICAGRSTARVAVQGPPAAPAGREKMGPAGVEAIATAIPVAPAPPVF